ncbi:MAG: O-antigen/teichoic acid export membrane protein [Paraglaciecola sp.]|jgi:O-antigen/teichoic acid export membrane protein
MKQLLRRSTLLLALKILTSLLGLLFYYLLAKQLGVEEFGLFSLAATCLLFTSALAKQGLEPSIVRIAAQYGSSKKGLINKSDISLGGLYLFVLLYSGVMALIIASCLYVFANTIAIDIFNKPVLADLLPLTAALTVIQTWMAINSSMLRGRSHAALSMVFTGIVTFSVVLVMFYYYPPHSALLAIEQLTIAAAIACFLSFVVTLLKIKPLTAYRQFEHKSILSSNAWLFIAAMAALTTQQLSVLVLGRYASLEQVGVFSIAIKVSMLLSYPLLAVNAYTAPQYAKFGAEGAFKALKHLANQANKVLLVVGSIGVVILFFLAEHIAGFFGEAYLPAADIIRILLIGQWVNLATGSVVSILVMNGYEKIHSRNSLIIMLMNIVALCVLVPSYGVLAAAWITTIIMASKNLVSWFYVNKLIFVKAGQPL